MEDGLGEERDQIDLGIMKPMVQLGGVSYGRVRDTFELPRPSFAVEIK
jgi:hypothetical protein